jgi:hypothetical protein
MQLELVSTLHIQRNFFAQPRGLERFRRYLATLIGETGDVAVPINSLNPMGREHNAAKVEELIAMDAEGVARATLAEAKQRLAAAPGAFRFSLVVVDNLRGMWSHRFTGELGWRMPTERTLASLSKRFVELPCWVDEAWTPASLRSVVLVMCYRLAWWQTRSLSKTLGEVMQQEGQAMRFAGMQTALPADDLDYSRHVLDPHRAATETPILMVALFGDEAAHELGYPPLGLSPRAGLEVALAEAVNESLRPEGVLR